MTHAERTEATLTDTLHLVWAVVAQLLMLSAIGFAAVELGKPFRLYTIATVLVFFVFGVLTFMDAPRLAANQPTPWIGVWERVNIGAWLLGVIVLAITLLRQRGASPSPKRKARQRVRAHAEGEVAPGFEEVRTEFERAEDAAGDRHRRGGRGRDRGEHRETVTMRAWIVGLALVGVTFAPLDAQQAGHTITKRGTITEDLYLAGGTVDVRADLQGDLVAAGGRILVEQRVTGDVIVGGGTVEVGAEVLDDVRAAGGTVTLRGVINGDAVVTGGTVELRPEATVGGRAWFGGGTVEVAGRVATHLKAGAEKIIISGVVEGDASVTAEEIEILPSARIGGTLTYRSPREARIASGAQVGGVTRLPFERPSLGARIAARVLWVAGLAVIGAVVIVVFPGFMGGAVRTLRGEPGRSLGTGALLLVGLPIVAVLVMITVVGIGLGVVGLVVYGFALLAGYLVGALSIGDATIGLIRPRAETTTGAWIGALVIGLAVIAVLRIIPVIGAVVAFGALLVGLGAMTLYGYRAWQWWRQNSGAPDAAAAA